MKKILIQKILTKKIKNDSYLLSKPQRRASKRSTRRYQNLSEVEKDRRWKKARDKYQNPSEKESEKKL